MPKKLFYEILIVTFLGVLAGIFTGLIPGVHINMVSILILSSSPFLLNYFSPLSLALFIVSMSITHTFLDSIPSIFLGAPDSGLELSVLPGHRLLLDGRGYEAVFLTIVGSFFAVVIALFFVPTLIPMLEHGYPLIEDYVAYILIAASVILIWRESKSRSKSLMVYLLAGLLGLGVLNLPLEQPLFPLLSGLFGTSILIVSLMAKTKIPEQRITYPKLEIKETLTYLGLGFIASLLTGTLPGLGASEAAIMSSSIKKKNKPEGFLILLGSINTFVMVVSFISLYAIDKARNGAVLVISKILLEFNFSYLFLFLFASLFVAGVASFLALKISKIFSKVMSRVNYAKVCMSVISLIVILVFLLTGPLGLFVLIVSTLLGITTGLMGIGKNHLMGCLLLPVILFFLL
ncbi:tripartite tricarboxylate transporter permease [Candidatus Woesearchaeota archaeon]|nr:tripartite tricarboxylate transporter permease [Candidatus Woesearchaeota archaeon]